MSFGGRPETVQTHTLVYLIAEQEVISKQGGILNKKVKRAGLIYRAGWKFISKKLSEQDVIREQGRQ